MEINEIKLLKKFSDKGMPPSKIAETMSMNVKDVKKKLAEFGFKINKEDAVKRSYGAAELGTILRELFGRYVVIDEYNIGERLEVDFFIKGLSVGVEYDGKQHEEYVEHFHGNKKRFRYNIALDRKKEEICKARGILLVRFSEKELKSFTKEYVLNKVMNAMIGA